MSLNKQNPLILLLAGMMLSLAASPAAAAQPVLVELYTSEGCSSCPPADDILAKFQAAGQAAGVPVICLGYHVDYWDGLGWKDRWSSKEATRRQSLYNTQLKSRSNYTPQTIVDGAQYAVGSNEGAVQKLITAAGASPKIPVTATAAAGGGAILRIGQVPAAPTASNGQAELMMAVVADNLQSDVKRGENSGRKLKHSSVVTHLKSLGSRAIQAGASAVEIPVDLTEAAKLEHSRIVFFLQDSATLRILGACQLPLP